MEENQDDSIKRIRTFNPETGREFLAPANMVDEYWSKMTGFIPIEEPSLGINETAKPHMINLDEAMNRPNPYAMPEGNNALHFEENVNNFDIATTQTEATIPSEGLKPEKKRTTKK